MINLLPNETFFFVWAIFLVVLFVLSQFVFKPTLKLIEERKNRTGNLQDEVSALTGKTASMIADYEQKMLKARQEAGKERDRLMSAAREEERKIVSKAREENDATLEQMRASIAKDREEAATRLKQQADVLARTLVDKILDRSAA